MIEVSQIRIDGGTQSRAAINEETVAEYAEAMADPNTVFPPIVVYYDGKEYWLADGFHRVEAWRRIGREEVPAEVRQGDRRRAILHSCGANAAHGLRRSNADKRRAVMTLLEDAEWSQWSDREIARQVRVSPSTVAKYREEVSGVTVQMDSEPRTYTTKHGTTAQMDTGNIGKREPQPEMADCQPDRPPAPPDSQDCQPAAPEPQPDPYGYARLTEAALLDLANGLRADLDEAKAKLKALKQERDQLKQDNKELSESTDLGPAVSQLKKQIATIKGTRDDALAEKARVNRQLIAVKKERDKLQKQLERQEITL